MPGYEYKIVPAPDRAKKIRGVKGPDARFAATLEESLNILGSDGWEFVRTEVFSVEERTGLTGKKSVDRQVMVFRKALPAPAEATAPMRLEPAPVRVPEPDPATQTEDQPVFSSEGRGPRILGRPVPPLSRASDSPQDAD